MPSRWYILRTKAVHKRYGLSAEALDLLQELEFYHNGSIDADELGRNVRLSPKRRTTVANTITKCAAIIKDNPEETKTCLEIIEMCSEILEIADRKPPIESFPFMRLPTEIREKIVSLIIDRVFRWGMVVPTSSDKLRCGCAKFDCDHIYQTEEMKALPVILGRSLKDEFFRIFYSRKTFRFRCACELYKHLARNERLVANVRHVQVHWAGSDSVEAFRMLAKCPRLEMLTLVLSKSTYIHLSRRARLLRTFFQIQYRTPRITDMMGLDELLELRGLKRIDVWRPGPASGGNRVAPIEHDRAGLAALLTSRLTLPRPPTRDENPSYYTAD